MSLRTTLMWSVLLASSLAIHAPGQGMALERIGSFQARGADFEHKVFDSTGARLLTCGDHDDLILWDCDAWRELARLAPPGRYMHGFGLHPKAPVAVIGADKFADAAYKKNFSEAYPGDSLANLWPWPKEPQWYADVRTEFRNKIVNA